MTKGGRSSLIRQARRQILWPLRMLIILLAVLIGLRVVSWALSPVLQCSYMSSGCMAPTLKASDILISYHLAYRSKSPQRGDIVLFNAPGVPTDVVFVQRTIAVGGDRLLITKGKVYVNDMDNPISEPYIADPPKYEFPGDGKPFVVPEDHIFVLGDNRNNSNDSRRFGPVADENLVGKVIAIFGLPERAGRL